MRCGAFSVGGAAAGADGPDSPAQQIGRARKSGHRFGGVAQAQPALAAVAQRQRFQTRHAQALGLVGHGLRQGQRGGKLILADERPGPAQIHLERKDYYAILERTQKGDIDVTAWLQWFLGCLDRAFDGAEDILANVLRKAHFWEAIKDQPLNARQRTVINRMLDGFEGKLTSSKWAKLTKSSPDTALRDITDLVERGVLVRDGAGGRSTSYSLRAVE